MPFNVSVEIVFPLCTISTSFGRAGVPDDSDPVNRGQMSLDATFLLRTIRTVSHRAGMPLDPDVVDVGDMPGEAPLNNCLVVAPGSGTLVPRRVALRGPHGVV